VHICVVILFKVKVPQDFHPRVSLDFEISVIFGPHPQHAHRRGKGPLEIAPTPDVSVEESNKGTGVDAYLNTTMFSTQ
jgi:hypothetical protein